MSRSYYGQGLTERFYRAHRLLMLSLVYLIRATWKGLGLDGGRNAPGVVATFLDQMIDLLEYFHELSLAMSHDYFVTYSLVEYPERLLVPMVDEAGEPFRARWGAMDVQVGEELDDLAEPILKGRVAEIPGATEALVDEKARAEVHDVDAYPRVGDVMGREFAGDVVDESQSPEVVEDERGDVPEPGPADPIVLAPDPNPVEENNARTRLQIKGPDNLEKQTEALHHAEYLDDAERQRRLQDKSDKSWVRTANAATTLADAGVDYVNAAAASQAMGVVRVLGPNPCPFCVMLAALGMVYEQGSWDVSNAKFRTHLSSTGKAMQGGNAKVHDGCQCRLEPVALDAEEHELPPGVDRARALWKQAVGQMPDQYTWSEQYNNFRRMFRDGKFVEKDWTFERPMVVEKREELRLRVAGEMTQLAFLEQYEGDAFSEAQLESTKEFHRGQLEYALQQWEKYGFEETDWTREYEWMLERTASQVGDRAERYRLAKEAKQTFPGTDDVVDQGLAFQDWLEEQYPDADSAKFWPADRMEPYPMPEFD